ncbi:MAG: rhodanese-like domain-containing protein [Magnetococcus sp. WYHC-3]
MKITIAAWIGALMFGWGAGVAYALPPVPEEAPAGIKLVASDDVLKAMEGGAATLLDSRKQTDFEGGTIPGSLSCQVSSGDPSVADPEVMATMEKLAGCEALKAADKGKPIISFCNGVTCWRSLKAALALVKMGFTQVEWYRLGMNDWKEKGLPTE